MVEETVKLNVETNVVGAQQAKGDLAGLRQQVEALGTSAVSTKDKMIQFNMAVRAMRNVEFLGRQIAEAAQFIGKCVELKAELQNLEKNIPVSKLELMQKATQGTVDKMTLMRLAMKEMNGDIKLTDAGLQTLLLAAENLHKKGFGPTAEIAEKLSHAMDRGTSRSLRDLGIAMKDAADKNENLNSMMEKFKEIASETPVMDKGLEQIERAHAAWTDFITDAKTSLGELAMTVASTATQVLNALHLLDTRTDKQKEYKYLKEEARRRANEQYPSETEDTDSEAYLRAEGVIIPAKPEEHWQLVQLREQYYQKILAENMAKIGRQDQLAADAQKRGMEGQLFDGDFQDAPIPWYKKFNKDFYGPERPRRGAKGRHYDWLDEMQGELKYKSTWDLSAYSGDNQRVYGSDNDYNLKLGAAAHRDTWFNPHEEFIGNEFHDPSWSNPYEVNDANMAGGLKGMRRDQDDLVKFKKFQADIQDSSKLAGQAFSSLSAGLGAAVDAAITGSESIGKAFAKATGAALKNIAIESTVRALYETAMGFAALAFGPINGVAAAAHFQAAAVFAATAAAAGAGSALLGGLGGGSGPNAGSKPSGGLVGTNNQQQQGPVAITVNITGAVTAGDYAKLAETIQKSIQLGQQAGRSRSQGNLTVAWE